MKDFFKRIIPQSLWKAMRMRSILRNHKRCASICDKLIEDYFDDAVQYKAVAKKSLETDKVIWQYWAQGYDNVPDIVRKCLESVDKYTAGCTVIRLTDANIEEYLEIPDYIKARRSVVSHAFFSDLLRVMLLSCYGGLWLDATVLLSGPIPEEYFEYDFFLFQRDPEEKHKDYWENAYAYYFGWNKRFRVNMLSSIFFAKKGTAVINALAGLMMKWWKENESVPDYFFLQILFDVLIKGKLKGYNCPVVSDCPPHYMQQAMNDDNFNLIPKNEIKTYIPIHKLTYKESNGKNQR